jgi:8-oxo-dGTP diphosphatase
MKDRPKVGIAIFIVNDKNEILLGLRKSKLGNNTWSLPGGKLEKYEKIEDCIIREAKEETNLDINDLVFISLTNDIMEDTDEHYVTIFFSTTNYTGELKTMESDKCEEWKWVNPKEFPSNLFLPLKNFIDGNFIG